MRNEIDADKIDFNKVFVGASEFAQDTRNAAQMLIAAQPTAYYVDKVVEELEKIEQHCLDMSDWQGQSAIFDAIEIVKQGGASDNVCEWEQGKGGTGLKRYKASCCNKSLDMPIKTAIDLNYCPYCGKKIKVVE